LLSRWASYLGNAAQRGALTGDRCELARIETIAGPRAGALEILAGLDAGDLLRALRKNDAAILRQFVPWRFPGDPQIFMSGRYLRVEAAWPEHLAETVIRLEDLSPHPKAGGRWVAGKNETGATVIAGLSDTTPHYLVAGTTGSGKSVALRSAVLQLARDGDNEIVLVDGKMGESLKAVEHVPGVVGPCAVQGMQIRGALGWTAQQMRQRYANGHSGRLICVVDEFQELVADDVVVDLLRRLVAQGRAADVHCLLATQHPTVKAFGDASIRRNLVGKLALRVGDPDASRVAVGGRTPRADHLLGAGDSYTIGPGACHRVQLAYVDRRTVARAGAGRWRLGRWPELIPEDVGRELPGSDVEEVGWSYDGEELAHSIIAASQGEGRPSMVDRLAGSGLGRPGAERAIRLLRLGREAHNAINKQGYAVCLSASGQTEPRDGRQWTTERRE
jgi:hypothetical protein